MASVSDLTHTPSHPPPVEDLATTVLGDELRWVLSERQRVNPSVSAAALAVKISAGAAQCDAGVRRATFLADAVEDQKRLLDDDLSDRYYRRAVMAISAGGLLFLLTLSYGVLRLLASSGNVTVFGPFSLLAGGLQTIARWLSL